MIDENAVNKNNGISGGFGNPASVIQILKETAFYEFKKQWQILLK